MGEVAKVDIDSLPSYSKLVELVRFGEMSVKALEMLKERISKECDSNEAADDEIKRYVKSINDLRKRS